MIARHFQISVVGDQSSDKAVIMSYHHMPNSTTPVWAPVALVSLSSTPTHNVDITRVRRLDPKEDQCVCESYTPIAARVSSEPNEESACIFFRVQNPTDVDSVSIETQLFVL